MAAASDELQPWQLQLLEAAKQLRIDPARCAELHAWAREAPSNDLAERAVQATWRAMVLPSGHSGESVDILIKLAIRRLGVSRQEANELMQLGREVALKADRKFRDGGMSWEKFILQRLRWDLPKRLRKLRRNAQRTVSIDHFAVRGQKGIAREITLDLEDTGEYGQETLELAALYGGGSVIHGLKALRQRSPIEDQLCAQGGGADTPDSQQKLIDRILRKLSPEDRNVLVRVFGLIDGKEHSDAELGEVLKVSKATAGRKRHRAVARGRAEILLSEQKLAELTGTTVPSQQMAVLRSLEVLHEPPKPWQLGSRDDSGRRTVTERGVKPIVVWLSDVRYLMRPERVEQLEKKLTQLLSTLLTSHVPPWLEDAYGTAVNTVGQALQCLARIREGKFKL